MKLLKLIQEIYYQTTSYSNERCHPFHQLINKLTIHSVLIRAIIRGLRCRLTHNAQTILVMIKNLVIKLIGSLNRKKMCSMFTGVQLSNTIKRCLSSLCHGSLSIVSLFFVSFDFVNTAHIDQNGKKQ